ncbi:Protein kinase domain-containing protein [Nannocystis exedens]|uniref:Protein kinase domain-containing protein n=1 Tax=Nannocystis exedens TaxID=54 RepID=A0A1I1WB88_9BACT|nr:serine/threonine-protein kinase [Nannocystis exedens]PCC67590.1 serine/threonine protein kinase [Nannocystis exedens]SFD92417.1 Protein kinase domain-containing protein [Nannocystis exedens]
MADIENDGLLSNPNRATLSPREAAEQRWGTMIAHRYRVEELLSFDEMGALYRARDTERGVPCALRILPEIYARDPEIRDRFLRDAEAAQVLQHPNIIEVFGTGKLDDGSVYSVMQLLDGQNLRAVLDEEKRISAGRAVHIASQVCRALGTAHDMGIIHRDLKPSNIVLVTQDGELDVVKVLDFGVCSHMDSERSGVSTIDKLVGSTAYMAPEQAAGEEADPVSDIYALGTVLFEMLTGRLPYTGRNDYDIMMKKGRQEAPRVDELVRDVPAALADLVARCLAPRPENRIRSMRVLEVDLLRSLDAPAAPRAARSSVDLSERSAATSLSSGSLMPPPEPAAAVSHPNMILASASMSAPRPAPEPRTIVAPAKEHPHAWLWLVGAGTIAVVLVLFGPQMFGAAKTPPEEPPAPLAATQDVDDSTPPDPPKPIDLAIPQAVENAGDPLVLAGRADLALAEGRICQPAGECLRDYLAALKEIDPKHEAIERLTQKMPAAGLDAGRKALAEKRFHDAGQVFRCVMALAPETEGVKELLAEALVGEGKILRLMKAWDDLAALLEEYDKLGVKPGFDALVLKGQGMAGKGRWQESVDAYAAAAKLRPNDKDVKKALDEAKQQLKSAEKK